MPPTCIAPDVAQLEIVMDSWTEPFWRAAADEQLVVPRCGECGHFRWPPGPFCPECQSQETRWVSPGLGRIYSFTIVNAAASAGAPAYHVPVLVQFAEAGGLILLGSLVGAELDTICINAEVSTHWSPAANTKVPVFRLAL
jgi:uncharacterized protein